ncbi:MAG TPA: protein translocase subunit SecF [Anaerolineae bacterium]|nr:protein translocase subunit SecF [Anaerolineae bacterium]
MWNIVGRRYWYFAFSLLIILPGLFALVFFGLPLAIDFTGGSLLKIQFEGAPPPPAEIKTIYNEFGFDDSQVQSLSNSGIQIRSRTMETALKDQIEAAIRERHGAFTELEFSSVSATIGLEVVQRALQTIGVATIGIMLYLWFAFRQVPHSFRYSVAAILGLLHDVAVIMGTAALFGQLLGWQVDALFLTALLTMLGFSVQDKIVVFDRIRENLLRRRGERFEQIVNSSLIQTVARSLVTQLTMFFTMLALALFGGITIHNFVVILLVGLLSGTYSSLFNAAQILVVWENREWRWWFRRKKPVEQAA